jgi:acetoin utilization deacetylase AcuC-like enzyme
VSGFHHASYSKAGGFCTFNGLMVTALRLLRDRRVRRVMIIDCDQHLGNGTDDIIDHLKIDAVDNVTFARWFATSPQAGRYLERLALEAARFSQFDLILYQAGADVHVDDPLGGILDTGQMRERDRIVFAAAKRSGTPLAWDLAGGYQEPLEKLVRLHVNTMRECVAAYGRARCRPTSSCTTPYRRDDVSPHI